MQKRLEAGSITADQIIANIQANEKWWSQVKDNPDFEVFVQQVLETYQDLEKLAALPLIQRLGSSSDSAKIRAIWVISAPGTYFKMRKNDRYADKVWAHWGDRTRLNTAFKTARLVTEQRSGLLLSARKWPEVDQIIEAHGPFIVYNGNPEENQDLSLALETPWLRMPDDSAYSGKKVRVIDANLGKTYEEALKYNTVIQTRELRLGHYLPLKPGDKIGILAHAPQLTRLLYILSEFPEAIPEGCHVQAFPIKTPDTGLPEYPIQEIRGTTFYRFIANPPLVGTSPFPYLR